jgi:arsenate reductase
MKYVLFVCVHNAGRSQMARAFFDAYAPADIRAESAGSDPAKELYAPVVEAMAEVGIDITGQRPEKLSVEAQLHADWAVTMGCGDACPYVPTTVEDWDLPDPSGKSLEEVRAIRDAISVRVRDLVDQRLDAIRADRTAHQLRLERLLPSLIGEFDGTRTPEEIRACADAALARVSDGSVRSFSMTLAHRRTRECLKRDQCDLVAV